LTSSASAALSWIKKPDIGRIQGEKRTVSGRKVIAPEANLTEKYLQLFTFSVKKDPKIYFLSSASGTASPSPHAAITLLAPCKREKEYAHGHPLS
jgi:hypothetical protein